MKILKVLVACEESQAVTIEFRKLGHEAYSCDLQSCSGGHPEWHFRQDIFNVIKGGYLITQQGTEVIIDKWDIMIGHPPCTYISYAGTQSWDNPGRIWLRLEALTFFAKLWDAPIAKICLENPKSCASPTIAKYSQEIQPFYFGDPFYKTTWLWLKGLPKLQYTKTDNLFEQRTATDTPIALSVDNTIRAKKRHWTESGSGSKGRSKTFPGIAEAMATQWSNFALNTTT